MPPHTLKPARVIWNQDTPVSIEFDDMYFNVQAGLAETEHVFLRGNQLPERFSHFSARCFTIAETGFGTGLNFLAARALWLEQAPDDAHLHFISVEKYPLQPEDLKQALTHWPALATGADQLLAQYPGTVPGFHQLTFDNGRVTLTLMLGDAIEAYSSLYGHVDAWFLDGFSPAKNPEMWQPELFQQMARLSRPGTTLATFTAAGFVRRGLQAAGFEVEKTPGFGCKREMVQARFEGDVAHSSPTPWFDPPFPSHASSAVVIGAGIAGCATAYALAQRGIQVTLIERDSAIAPAGSGNRQGALYAKLPVNHNAQGQLHLLGLLHTLRLLKQIDPAMHHWSDCGLLQLALNDKERSRQQQLFANTAFGKEIMRAVSQDEASRIAGTQLSAGGLFMPLGGWAAPVELCRMLTAHPLIELRLDCELTEMTLCPDTEQWILNIANAPSISTPIVVVCTAAEAKTLPQLSHLPIKPIRGQTSVAAMRTTALDTVVCGDGYISPAQHGQYCFGATFDLHNLELSLRSEDHNYNLSKLGGVAPALAQELQHEALSGHVAHRCSTADYLPIAGAAPVYDDFVSDYGKLRSDRKWRFPDVPARHWRGLYVNVGHGSKGLITAPLCADMVASAITGQSLPMEKVLVDAVNPARFIIKNLIRKTI